jgi:hypothetical protein
MASQERSYNGTQTSNLPCDLNVAGIGAASAKLNQYLSFLESSVLVLSHIFLWVTPREPCV